MSYTAAVITVSDKGYRGDREDTAGPNLCRILSEKGFEVIYTSIVPDDKDKIISELKSCCDVFSCSLVLTAGGTGFSPRDITPEAALEIIERETPGIAELMRFESLKITPRGCLSRSVSGIRGRSLIITLPGSKKASQENLEAVLDPIMHGLEMLAGEGSANCGEALPRPVSEPHPSVDSWLSEAKKSEAAGKIGMFLFHNGVVRGTSKAEAHGTGVTPPVLGMHFDYDEKILSEAICEAQAAPGISTVKVWLNRGELKVGDDMMYVLIGGDIRPNVISCFQMLMNKIKKECVTEEEEFGSAE